MTEEELIALGKKAKAQRLLKGWSKERAAREAGVSSITYKRVEDGLGVQDAKRAAITQALEISHIAGHDSLADNLTSVSAADHHDPEFEFLTRVREDLTTEEMDQLMREATPYLEMLVRDIKNRNREQA